MAPPSSSEPVRRNHFIPQATPAEVYAVVVDFEAYPRMFSEISSARVLERDGQRVRVEFNVQVVLSASYTLDLVCDPQALTVDWTFVTGKVVSGLEGGWRFTAEGGGTRVDYFAALEIDAPRLPGFIKRKMSEAIQFVSLPAMFTSLTREVGARRAGAAAAR